MLLCRLRMAGRHLAGSLIYHLEVGTALPLSHIPVCVPLHVPRFACSTNLRVPFTVQCVDCRLCPSVLQEE